MALSVLHPTPMAHVTCPCGGAKRCAAVLLVVARSGPSQPSSGRATSGLTRSHRRQLVSSGANYRGFCHDSIIALAAYSTRA